MGNETDEYVFPDEAREAADRSAGTSSEMGDGPEVEVVIVDDTPEGDRGRKPLDRTVDDPTDDELQEYSGKVQGRIKELTHARHDERRRADALQRERDELQRIVQTTMGEREEMRRKLSVGAKVVTEQNLTLADNEVAQAMEELEAAHEAFDTKAIVKAQVALNEAQMRKATATNIRQRAVQEAEDDVKSPVTAPTAAPKLDEKTQQWMSANKWFGDKGDKAMTGYALGLHQELVDKNGDAFVNTDEYYSQINAAVRRTFPASFKPKAGSERSGSVVAPATRNLAPRKVTLTSTQMALAARYGLTPQQYAAELVKLEN